MSENTPKTLADVAVGDEVVMVFRTGRLTNGKSDDRVYRCVVIEAKRVNLTITEKGGTRRWHVRRDTGTGSTPDQQRYAAGGGMYGWKAYTVAQHESMERRIAAFLTLRKHGIDTNSRSPWHGREVELADLLTEYVADAHTHANIINHPGNGDLLRGARSSAS